ncbi:MAG: TetR/AcrR family transcriptional regulator [Clostridia bacterium]|nr:TetR/AcrR family transcriptional regulator [Clostridia bacterium]
MNEKFFALPQEKRQRIIQAGFRVFSENSYRKSPMSEIAGAAGISKPLLFHYFHNKKELYLFLVSEAVRIAEVELAPLYTMASNDLFELFQLGMEAKMKIALAYPDLTAFIVKAYYEQDPEVASELARICQQLTFEKYISIVDQLNPDDFIPGLDLKMMYSEMYWAADGCLRALLQVHSLDATAMEAAFSRLIAFWKSVYLRKDEP